MNDNQKKSVQMLFVNTEIAPLNVLAFVGGMEVIETEANTRLARSVLSVLVPLGRPLFGVAEGYGALRVDVRVWLERPPL